MFTHNMLLPEFTGGKGLLQEQSTSSDESKKLLLQMSRLCGRV